MSPAHVRKVAGTEPPAPAAAQNAAVPVAAAPADLASSLPPTSPPSSAALHNTAERPESTGPTADSTSDDVQDDAADRAADRARKSAREAGAAERSLAVQDRLASWVCDLSLVHELTERLARTAVLDDTLHEVLRAGATLVGARRGLITLAPADGLGPDSTVALGLGHADIGTLETVPHAAAPAETGAGAADTPGSPDLDECIHPDLLHEPGLDPRHREVAAHLGLGASYALRLSTAAADASGPGEPAAPTPAAPTASTNEPDEPDEPTGTPATPGLTGLLGTAVWFYDEPAEPIQRQRRLMGLYLRFAAEHIARVLELSRARATTAALAAELLPARLPRVPGVRMAVRHRTGPRGGGDWYDALPLPEGALGLAVGGVTGAGPSAVAAMGRLRASLRAYAVMEGEDPVAVLSDLELLMRLTEPARSATALFAYAEPAPAGQAGGAAASHRAVGRKIILAGAGHCPPLLVGDHRCEYVETSLSAPLNMLSCWEAPSVELHARPGETLLLYTDGLLHRTGEAADRAFARLHTAAQSAPRPVRDDPDQLADHILHTLLPDGLDQADSIEDVVLLAIRFD